MSKITIPLFVLFSSFYLVKSYLINWKSLPYPESIKEVLVMSQYLVVSLVLNRTTHSILSLPCLPKPGIKFELSCSFHTHQTMEARETLHVCLSQLTWDHRQLQLSVIRVNICSTCCPDGSSTLRNVSKVYH